MIDEKKIRQFWEERGRKFSEPVAEMANLEPDPELQAMKSKLEKEVVMSRLNLRPDMNVLDLGAGYGQWALRFAPHVKSVCAVEYSRSMMEAGKKEARTLGLDNIIFVHSPAEDFHSNQKWNMVFVSGLLMYLNDYQCEKVAKNIVSMLASESKVFLREPVSLLQNRHIIEDKWSEAVGACYSALYRKPDEIIDLFKPLKLLEEGYFFPDGNPLNKWKETRLKFFLFEKSAG